jgi:hypothetical protein
MEKATDIIARLGGTTNAARLLELPITTVDGWRARNKIPEWRKRDVETELAKLANNPQA